MHFGMDLITKLGKIAVKPFKVMPVLTNKQLFDILDQDISRPPRGSKNSGPTDQLISSIVRNMIPRLLLTEPCTGCAGNKHVDIFRSKSKMRLKILGSCGRQIDVGRSDAVIPLISSVAVRRPDSVAWFGNLKIRGANYLKCTVTLEATGHAARARK